MSVSEIVVEGQQNHEREEHRQGRQKVPDVVVVEEVQKGAGSIVRARLGWCKGPGYRLAVEEVKGTAPGHERQEYVA